MNGDSIANLAQFNNRESSKVPFPHYMVGRPPDHKSPWPSFPRSCHVIPAPSRHSRGLVTSFPHPLPSFPRVLSRHSLPITPFPPHHVIPAVSSRRSRIPSRHSREGGNLALHVRTPHYTRYARGSVRYRACGRLVRRSERNATARPAAGSTITGEQRLLHYRIRAWTRRSSQDHPCRRFPSGLQ